MIKHRYNIFPEMLPEDYSRLKTDLFNNGYDHKYPIYIFENEILDGWNRFRACTELSITPQYRNFEGTPTDAIMFVMRTNKRRNLTSSQLAAIAVEVEEIIAAIEKEVEEERRKKQAETQSKGAMQQLIVTQPKNRNITDQKVAEVFNTNRTYINDAARLKEEKPEVFEQVKRGEKTLTEVKKEEKKQARQEKIKEIRENIAKENLIITDKFDVIAIDPPWAYGEKGAVKSEDYDPDTMRGITPYPTLTVKELSELVLPAKENCVLFLWTTHAFLRDAFSLVDAWGFKYKATIVWDKEKMGIGRNIRMQCEFCLLAIKGDVIINGSSERDIIREARREHSRKPVAFYDMVERMTMGSRIDYFAREQRKGWKTYGAETEKF